VAAGETMKPTILERLDARISEIKENIYFFAGFSWLRSSQVAALAEIVEKLEERVAVLEETIRDMNGSSLQ
jgi:polyhydroxyalkanoate synthesis regulator phasin